MKLISALPLHFHFQEYQFKRSLSNFTSEKLQIQPKEEGKSTFISFNDKIFILSFLVILSGGDLCDIFVTYLKLSRDLTRF